MDDLAPPTPLRDGLWAGRRVLVVGGGPSLRGFDFTRLADEQWIGINAAWRHDPPISFVLDQRMQRTLIDTPAWRAWRGRKVWHQVDPSVGKRTPLDGLDVEVLDSIGVRHRKTTRWSHTLDDGLVHGNHAGTSALNLACLLAGPRGEVYLLGYDYRGEGGRTAQYHDDYPEDWRSDEGAYDAYRADLEQYAPDIAAFGTRVFNVSPGGRTALTAWPVLDDLPKPFWRPPLVVGYASPEYEEEARGLEASARLFGLRTRIARVPPFASWQDACKFKPRMLADLLATADGPLLYVDADARFRQGLGAGFLLDLIGEGVADVYCHVVRRRLGSEQPAPGTIFLPPSGGRAFVARWLQALERNEAGTDSLGDCEAFGVAWAEWREKGRAIELPPEYCWIHDLHPTLHPGHKPVIEHYQASRRMRGRIGS